MLKLVSSATLTEKILIGVFSLLILISTFQIGNAFYQEVSEPAPAHGGTFVEGVIGEFNFLNPILAQTDLDRDVSKLVFCGLTNFDPISNAVVDGIADHTLSPDQRTYTFTLKENLRWHDGTPLTADDVIYTFREVIQHEEFPNPTLAADFFDVLITKIDERTVTMTLRKKYAFFIYNTTIGLLPRHLLKDVPVRDLLTTNFNLQPVGCGPYKVDAISSSHIQLTAFNDYYKGRPFMDSVIFRLFSSSEQLIKNIDGITATKDLSDEHLPGFASDARLQLHDFTLPQYVALFFNTEREILRDKKLRLGLQLATDKQQILKTLDIRAKIIDTPLLEIATSDWKYDPDASRADGALFDAGWKYRDAAEVATVAALAASAKPIGVVVTSEPGATGSAVDPQFIAEPSSESAYTTTESEFFLTGTAPADSTKVVVNGYQLSRFQTGDTSWNYKASLELGTLKTGENEYVVKNEDGEFDRIMIFYSPDADARSEWLAEQQAEMITVDVVAEVEKIETKPPQKSPKNGTQLRYKDNQPLALKLLVTDNRPEFLEIAEEVAEQWSKRGVKLTIELLPRNDFLRRLSKRDYDIVLFGENLGYNLDAYPFWHSSEARIGGSNLSNLKSSAINAWLEQIRSNFDFAERRKRLANLRAVLSEEVPAIMLYTPTYSYAIDKKIKNFNLGRIALKRDRLANLNSWYLREKREVQANTGVWSFLKWFARNL